MKTRIVLLCMAVVALFLGLCPVLQAANINITGTCGMTISAPGLLCAPEQHNGV